MTSNIRGGDRNRSESRHHCADRFRERDTVTRTRILAVLGRLGVEDGVVNLRAEAFHPLRLEEARAVVGSHDFR